MPVRQAREPVGGIGAVVKIDAVGAGTSGRTRKHAEDGGPSALGMIRVSAQPIGNRSWFVVADGNVAEGPSVDGKTNRVS